MDDPQPCATHQLPSRFVALSGGPWCGRCVLLSGPELKRPFPAPGMTPLGRMIVGAYCPTGLEDWDGMPVFAFAEN